jgi:hypothetical protein
MLTGGSMLDFVTKNLAVFSVIAVAALSIFNFGYFSKIGIQFLGIVDLNNFVYSFGLASALLLIVIYSGWLLGGHFF